MPVPIPSSKKPYPLRVGTCVVWLDASDTDTSRSIEPNGGFNQWIWYDKSGGGLSRGVQIANNSTINPSTGTRTKNSRNVIDFDGTDDYLEGGSNLGTGQPYTLFVVCVNDDGADGTSQAVIATNSGTATNLSKNTGNQWNMNDGTNRNSSTTPNTNWHYFTKIGDGANSILRLDGTTIISSGSTIGTQGWSANKLRVGRNNSTQYWDGAVAEVLIYNTALSSTDYGVIEAYLAAKWAI